MPRLPNAKGLECQNKFTEKAVSEETDHPCNRECHDEADWM
jgi:hypothetical protein